MQLYMVTAVAWITDQVLAESESEAIAKLQEVIGEGDPLTEYLSRDGDHTIIVEVAAEFYEAMPLD